MSTPSVHNGRLLKKTWLTPDVLWVQIALEEPMRWKAGQFVMLRLQDQQRPRAFSLMNAPDVEACGLAELCIKKYPESASVAYLLKLKQGGQVSLRGPFGTFTVADGKRPICFVGAGVGITPLLSQMRALGQSNDPRPRRVFFGARSPEDVFAAEVLRECCDDVLISLSAPDTEWRGARGRVTEHLRAIPDPLEHDYYICGSPDMVQDTKKILFDMQVPQRQVFFEIF